MSLSTNQKLTEALERGILTPAQESELEALVVVHPERREELNDDLGLNELLRQAMDKDAPVSSNFTARVIAMAKHETAIRESRSLWQRLVPRGWLPKLATAAAVLCVGLFAFHQHQLSQRKELAQNLVEMTRLTDGRTIELLQNFEAIQRLNQVPVDVDRELLAALE